MSASVDLSTDWHDFVQELRGLETPDLLRRVISDPRAGRVALVSSFGTEAAVLVHLVASIDPSVPVVLVDTKKLFGETLDYAKSLAKRFGLTALQIVTPDLDDVAREDPRTDLWQTAPEACCHIRKVLPLDKALSGVDTWISGRKRFHGGDRSELQAVEFVDGRLKINPLANWQKSEMDAYFVIHELPRHPLERYGYASIGCISCTDRVKEGEDVRAGRWRGQQKTECGIHISSAGANSSRLPKK